MTVEDVKELFNQLVAQALEKVAVLVEHASKRITTIGPVSDQARAEFEKLGCAIEALIDHPINKLSHVDDINVANIDQPVGPTCQESRQVEQGGDELVEACEELISQYEAVPEFTMGGKLTNGPFIKIRQAIANRRGGE